MRNISELRKADEKASEIVSDFLDEKFYPTTTANANRVYNVEDQVKGIDITFNLNDKDYICDEKAAVKYVNKSLQTFALELSFINRGNHLQDGWLLNEDNVNNSYMFIWIDKAKKDVLTNKDDIQELQLALVGKDSIMTYLNGLGWNKNNLIYKSQRIRENPSENKGDLYKNGCRFFYSSYFVEEPVNILLPRTKLIEISDYNTVLN